MKPPKLVTSVFKAVFAFCAVSVVLVVFMGMNVNFAAAADAAGRAVGETWNFFINAWEAFDRTADTSSNGKGGEGRF